MERGGAKPPEVLRQGHAGQRRNATVTKLRTAIRDLKKWGIVARTVKKGRPVEDKLSADYLLQAWSARYSRKTD